MRNINLNVISGSDHTNQASAAIPAAQLVTASFHAYFGDTNAAGTFKLQASNDVSVEGYQQNNFVPTNWVDIPLLTAAITSGASSLLTITQNSYRWLRALYTSTAAGVQTIAPIADTGVKQHQTVTTVDDVAGSLNSTYFLLSSVNLTSKAQKNFYLWLDDGAGVDPAVAGRTGIQVTYTDNDTASTIATNIRTALNALTNDFVATGASASVIITNVAFGPVPAAADSIPAPTTFTFGARTIGVASNLNNTYFLLQDASSAHKYIVWNNVDSIGTTPVVAGYTAVPIAFASGSSAATIGAAIAAAIATLNSSASFSTSGTTTVTVTNRVTGPFVAIVDGTPPTTFTFAVTGGGTTTVTVNMNAMGI